MMWKRQLHSSRLQLLFIFTRLCCDTGAQYSPRTEARLVCPNDHLVKCKKDSGAN